MDYILTQGMLNLCGLQFTPWHRIFVLCKKINGQWIFFKHVHRRIPATSMNYSHMYDYAVNDIELLSKT